MAMISRIYHLNTLNKPKAYTPILKWAKPTGKTGLVKKSK